MDRKNDFRTMTAIAGIMTASICLLSLTACGGGTGKPDSDSNPSDSPGYYSLSNEDGSRFLILPNEDVDEANVKTLTYAIYNSTAYRIKFIGKQQENKEENNHRETRYNFDNLEGFLFENAEGKLKRHPAFSEDNQAIDDGVYLCNDAFLRTHQLIPFYIVGEENHMSTNKIFEQKYGRKVEYSDILVSFGEDGENKLCRVQFQHKGDSALAILAFCTDDGKVSYIEFPAVADEYSTWRVDDGGEFYNSPILVNTVIRTNEGYLFLIDNYGAEGVNSYFLRQKGDKLVEDTYGLYRYTAPD